MLLVGMGNCLFIFIYIIFIYSIYWWIVVSSACTELVGSTVLLVSASVLGRGLFVGGPRVGLICIVILSRNSLWPTCLLVQLYFCGPSFGCFMYIGIVGGFLFWIIA